MQRLSTLVDPVWRDDVALELRPRQRINYHNRLPGAVNRLRKITCPFQSRRHGHKNRICWRDRVWFLKREKEKHFVSLFVRKNLWDLDRSPEVESPDIVAVERPLEPRLVGKKRRCVQGLVPQEVVSAPAVIACAALGDYIDDRSAVVPVLGSIVVAKDLDFGNGVLIRCHTDLI